MGPGRVPGDREAAAAHENAAWVDLFCRSHGVRGEFGERAWRSPRRTPPFYPDAVTTAPDATASDVLEGIDSSAGASVKDSFAALDLSPWGFRRLFDARWIGRDGNAPAQPPPAAVSAIAWRAVTTRTGLETWESAWAGGAPAIGFFPASLLADPRVRLLAGYDGETLVAGTLLHLTERVVGVSNSFGRGLPTADLWLSLVRPAVEAAGGRPLVGYLREEDLGAATRAGFEALGPLTVWVVGDDA